MRRNAVVLMCRNAPHTFSLSLLKKMKQDTSRSMDFQLLFLKNKNCIQRAQDLTHKSFVVSSASAATGFFHFLPRPFFFCFVLTAVYISHDTLTDPWQVMNWHQAKQHYRAAPRARALADSLAPAPWRHPFTAALQPVLAAPSRRLLWRRGQLVSAGSQLINGARALLRDRSSVRHLRSPVLRGPHTCIDLHFFAYV